MNHPDYEMALDGCVARLRLGESAENCLADYPESTQELAPLVNLAAEIMQLPTIEATPNAAKRGRAAMLAALPAAGPAKSGKAKHRRLPAISLAAIVSRIQPRWTAPSVRVAMVAIGALILSFVLFATASAASLPGEPLYPLKRTLEETRLLLTFDDQAREELKVLLEMNRRREVRRMVGLGRSGEAEFEGHLEAVIENAWIIDGINVEIDGETTVIGELMPGNRARVMAFVQKEGTIRALVVEVKSADGSGEIGLPNKGPTPVLGDVKSLTLTVQPTRTPEPSPTILATDTRNKTSTVQPTDRPPNPTQTAFASDIHLDPTQTPYQTDRLLDPTYTPYPTDRPLDPTNTPQPSDRLPDPTHTTQPSDRPHDTSDEDAPGPTDRPPETEPTSPASDSPSDPTRPPQPDDPTDDSTRAPQPTEPEDQSTSPRPSDRPHDSTSTSDDRT